MQAITLIFSNFQQFSRIVRSLLFVVLLCFVFYTKPMTVQIPTPWSASELSRLINFWLKKKYCMHFVCGIGGFSLLCAMLPKQMALCSIFLYNSHRTCDNLSSVGFGDVM